MTDVVGIPISPGQIAIGDTLYTHTQVYTHTFNIINSFFTVLRHTHIPYPFVTVTDVAGIPFSPGQMAIGDTLYKHT